MAVFFQSVVRKRFGQCGTFASGLAALCKALVVAPALEKPCCAASILWACIGAVVRVSLQRVPDFGDHHSCVWRTTRQEGTRTPGEMRPLSLVHASAMRRGRAQGMLGVRLILQVLLDSHGALENLLRDIPGCARTRAARPQRGQPAQDGVRGTERMRCASCARLKHGCRCVGRPDAHAAVDMDRAASPVPASSSPARHPSARSGPGHLWPWHYHARLAAVWGTIPGGRRYGGRGMHAVGHPWRHCRTPRHVKQHRGSEKALHT